MLRREKYYLGAWPVNSVLLDLESGLPAGSRAPVQWLDNEPHLGLPETATKESAPEGERIQSGATPCQAAAP